MCGCAGHFDIPSLLAFTLVFGGGLIAAYYERKAREAKEKP